MPAGLVDERGEDGSIAAGGGIGITLTTADHDENVRMRGVIERHIDRFAFREAPLAYEWKETEEAGQ